MEYPLISFKLRKKPAGKEDNIWVVFLDADGNRFGKDLKLRHLLSVAKIKMETETVSIAFSRSNYYRTLIVDSKPIPICYTKDLEGKNVYRICSHESFYTLQKNSYKVLLNPILMGTEYIPNTFKRSR